MCTSVPPDVKMMSSAFPPTILATFSLDWLIIALALVPRNKKDLNNTCFLKHDITHNLLYISNSNDHNSLFSSPAI